MIQHLETKNIRNPINNTVSGDMEGRAPFFVQILNHFNKILERFTQGKGTHTKT